MRNIILGIATIFAIFSFFGIGKEKTNFDISEYNNYGFKFIDLCDKDSYEEDGKKLAGLVKQLLEDPDQGSFMERKYKLFGGMEYKQTIDSNAHYYYIGDIKDGRPDGHGILYYACGDAFYIYYLGEFQKGKIKGYGVLFQEEANLNYISYMGEIKKEEEGEFVPADGQRVIPHNFYAYGGLQDRLLYGDSDEMDLEDYGIKQDSLYGILYLPQYVGEMKDGKYSGKGELYSTDGTLIYSGSFKKNSYSGKGTLYFEDGSIQYEGEFKKGKFNGKGTLYNKNGTIKHKGEFKNGDIK